MQPTRKIDVAALLAMHRKRWIVQESIGPITLRALPRIEAQRINDRLSFEHPEYGTWMVEFNNLTDLLIFPKAQTPENLSRLGEIAANLAPLMEEYAVACFVEPSLRNVEELHALASSLDMKEWAKLQELLIELTSQIPHDVNLAVLTICKEFGIPLATDLTAENMTVQQAAALEEVVERASETNMRVLKMALGDEK